MAKQGITTGTTPNDGTGDTLLSGAVKINSNFDELYDYFGNGTNLNFTSAVWPQNDTGIHTTRNVGIGTTTATEKLTVDGNISLPDNKSIFIGDDSDLEIYHGAAANSHIKNNSLTLEIRSDDTEINSKNNGTTFIKANASGVMASTGIVTATRLYSTNVNVTGVTTSGSFVAGSNVTAGGAITGVGSITGATIHGSGAALSNIVTSITAGAGVTVSGSTGTITISSASGGAQGYFQKNATGINTTSNVGIGTTTSTSALTVSGDGKFTGIVTATTFVGNVTGAVTGNVTGTASTATAAATAYGLTGTPNISVAVVSASSTITANKFVGDGSGLTGVTASGTGIIIKDDGSLVGTAGTIDFGTALSVSAISGAAVTVTATTPNNLTPATLTVAGVSTFSGNIKNGSDSAGTYWGANDDLLIKHTGESVITNSNSGRLSLQNTVEGQVIEIEPKGNVEINRYGGAMYAEFKDGNSVDLYFNGSKKFETSNEGSIISGITSTTTLEVNERYGVSTGFGTFVASAGVAHTVDTFTIASNNFKTAEYTLHLEETTNSQAQKVLVMQNGTNAFSNEYAVMYNGNLLVSIGSRVVGGAVLLEVTPRTGISGLTTYRFTRETMK